MMMAEALNTKININKNLVAASKHLTCTIYTVYIYIYIYIYYEER